MPCQKARSRRRRRRKRKRRREPARSLCGGGTELEAHPDEEDEVSDSAQG